MHSTTPVILLAGLAAAQSNVVKFISIPKFAVGQDGTIGWSTTDTQDPVEIVLKEPNAANPAVYNPNPIGTVVAAANPTLSSVQYQPTACGTSLALEILQGKETNYYGPFDISGACSSTAAATTAAPTSAASTVSASSATITSSSVINTNITTSFASNFTTTTAAPAGPSSYKTIFPPRNTTASVAGPGATASAPIPANPNSAVGVSSPLALVFGLVAALTYLL